MPDGSVPLLLSLIALIILSGFFSMTETAYTSVSLIRLRTLATNGNEKAKKVLLLAEEKYDKFLSTILVGNNIVNLTASTISALFFAKLITGSISPLISTVVITVAVLIFGEITPKFIAKVYPEKVAMAFYYIVIFFYYLFTPLNFIFSGWKWLISKIFRLKNDDIVTEEEIMTVVKEAEEDGTIRNDETKLIRSVIEFDDVEVKDILVPRVNMTAIEINDSMEKIKNVFNREGYSRLPVYNGSIDTIVGTLHQQDFFNAYLLGEQDIKNILQDACYTTEHVKISNLLKQLQKKKVHMAVVLDEYGGTLGLVTMEDVLEELVGEIYDEHDEEINYFKRMDEKTFIVDGNAPITDMFEYLSFPNNDEDFSSLTVSGWVIEQLGEIPIIGTKFNYKQLEIEILKATVKRVLQIKVINNKEEKFALI